MEQEREASRRRRYLVEFGPSIAEGRIQMEPRQTPLREGKGGRPVREFSAESRRNLWKAAHRIQWDELGFMALVTFTFPEEFPKSGKAAKRFVERFWDRWAYFYGERPQGIWCMEFQERRAVHFHAFLRVPVHVGFNPEDRYEDLKAWGFRVWSEVAGFPTVSAWELGMQKERGLRFNVSPAWYVGSMSAMGIAKYMVDHAGKGSQKELPADFEAPGRWWNVVGLGRGKTRVRQAELCCERSFTHFMRVVRRLRPRRRRGRRSGAQRRRWTRERAEWSERDRYLWRKAVMAERVRPWCTVGGWAAVANGYDVERVVAWAIGMCPVHRPSARKAWSS